jgi:hypothetical protein
MDDLLAGYDNPNWCGVGYLRVRQYALDGDEDTAPQPDRVAEADLRALEVANARGWSAEDLFEWLNSKNGRWYGDSWFFAGDDDDRLAQSIVDNLGQLDLAVLRSGRITRQSLSESGSW